MSETDRNSTLDNILNVVISTRDVSIKNGEKIDGLDKRVEKLETKHSKYSLRPPFNPEVSWKGVTAVIAAVGLAIAGVVKLIIP